MWGGTWRNSRAGPSVRGKNKQERVAAWIQANWVLSALTEIHTFARIQHQYHPYGYWVPIMYPLFEAPYPHLLCFTPLLDIWDELSFLRKHNWGPEIWRISWDHQACRWWEYSPHQSSLRSLYAYPLWPVASQPLLVIEQFQIQNF